MNTQVQYVLAVHAERLARHYAEAHRERPVPPARTETRRLRRALGRTLVRAGQLIAAEASPPDRAIEHMTPAGSR